MGQFLNIWVMPLEGSKVILFIDGNSTENYNNYVLKDREKMILKIEDYRNVLFNENCSTIINQITCVTVLEM